MQRNRSNLVDLPQHNLSTRSFSRIYESLGADHPNRQEFGILRGVIAGFQLANKRPKLRVLEIGSGDGRVARHLANEEGVDYVGIEPHSENVATARAALPGVSFLEGNFFQLSPKERFDIVIVPYTLVNMFPFDRQEVFLRKAVHHAQLFIFDVILPDDFGVAEDTVKHVSSEEFAETGYETTGYYFCKEHLSRILTSAGVNLMKTAQYPFMETEDGPFPHTFVIAAR